MERERIVQKPASRIIQQKQNHCACGIVDNRPYSSLSFLSNPTAQRVSEEDEETMQGKFDSSVQRMEDEDEEPLQGKFESPIQRLNEDEEDTVQGKFDKPIQKKNETGMPDNLKAGIESLSGFSMDNVHVHYNSSKPATVQALAYTQGTDIHVAPGQEKHLPHEAWHVAQQMAGRVSPTTSINGMPVNDNAALEHEADVMGEKAIQMKTEKNLVQNSVQGGNSVIQKVDIKVDEKDEKFYNTITGAYKEISDHWVVKGISDAPYLNAAGILDKDAQNNEYTMKDNPYPNNWGDILIKEGSESQFQTGDKADDSHLLLEMNVNQCENMIFGEDPNGTPQTVASVLLHELGHAYQHYLRILNKDGDEKEKKYPLFFEAIKKIKYSKEEEEKSIYEKRLNEALEFIGFKNADVRDDAFIEAIMIKISAMGDGAYNKEDDGDNIFMNEIPYNTKKGLSVREQYKDVIDKRFINFRKEVETFISGDAKVNEEELLKGTNKEIAQHFNTILDTATKYGIFLSYTYFNMWSSYLDCVIKWKEKIGKEIDDAKDVSNKKELQDCFSKFYSEFYNKVPEKSLTHYEVLETLRRWLSNKCQVNIPSRTANSGEPS